MIEFLTTGIFAILVVESITVLALERKRQTVVVLSVITIFSMALMSFFIKAFPEDGTQIAFLIGMFPLGILSNHIWENFRKNKKGF